MFGMQLSRVTEEGVGGAVGASELLSGVSQDTAEGDNNNEEYAALGFVNEWLGAIADSTVGLVVAQWLRVPSLSPVGRAQLIVDIEYVSNVVQAMGLKQHPLLNHLRQLLLKDPASLIAVADTVQGMFFEII